MIITKITFLYFIKIAQTDDFPSTGTRLVYITVVLFITVVFYFCLILCFVFSVRIDGRRVIAPLHLAPWHLMRSWALLCRCPAMPRDAPPRNRIQGNLDCRDLLSREHPSRGLPSGCLPPRDRMATSVLRVGTLCLVLGVGQGRPFPTWRRGSPRMSPGCGSTNSSSGSSSHFIPLRSSSRSSSSSFTILPIWTSRAHRWRRSPTSRLFRRARQTPLETTSACRRSSAPTTRY